MLNSYEIKGKPKRIILKFRYEYVDVRGITMSQPMGERIILFEENGECIHDITNDSTTYIFREYEYENGNLIKRTDYTSNRQLISTTYFVKSGKDNTKVERHYPDGEIEPGEITYQNDFIKSITFPSEEQQYIYNIDGTLASIITKTEDGVVKKDMEYLEFNGQLFDEHGNWKERIEQAKDGPGKTLSVFRSIEYYD